MKVFTVVHVYEEIEVSPFVYVYKSRERAEQAVEQAAIEHFEMTVDPNDGDRHVFPGLEWNDDRSEAWPTDRDEHLYMITEAELKD